MTPETQKMHDLAMSYLLRGWSVLPCGKNKIPLVSWREFQERYPTPAEVKGWFEKYPDAQVGIITGAISNLTVVDVEKGGDPSFLPQETMIASTGGGGYHYFFKFEPAMTNKARIKKLVDIRSEGGYVVAPGSCSEKGPYTLLQDAPLVQFPKELFPVDIFKQGKEYSGNFERRSLLEYPGYGAGQRNNEMARYIGYVLTQIHPADWDTEGWNVVCAANKKNTPPLPQNELKTTFESIKRTERQNNPLGHATGKFTLKTNTLQPAQQPQFLGDENDEIMHVADVAGRQSINQSEVYPLQMPCFDDVIMGGVTAGDLVVIAGLTGNGKTTLAQDWTMSLLRGDPGIKALWFSYEVLASHLWSKFQSMGANREDLVFIPAKHSTGNVAWVEAKIKEGKEKFGIKAVFIDHLGFLLPKSSSMFGGKQMSLNYSSFLTQVVRDLKTIAIAEEVVIFLPVHMKKVQSRERMSDLDDIKDSSGIGQESDLVFLIERERNKDKDVRTYFTENTKITLAKNRKTGITVVGDFKMLDGRFCYDNTWKESEDKFNELTRGANSDEVHATQIQLPYKDDITEEKTEKKIATTEEEMEKAVDELWPVAHTGEIIDGKKAF